MKLQFVKYNPIYLKSCAKLVTETWTLDDQLINASQSRHLFYYYVRNCVYNSIYTNLIVDQETQRVLGILCGSDDNHTSYKSSIRNFQNSLILFKHIILGHLGKRIVALKFIREMSAIEKSIEKYCEKFDGELNLFVLSKELQGQGYGQKLMNHYIQFCKNQRQMETIFVWADIGCNYRFYENYGFRLYKHFFDDRLTEHSDLRTDKSNGFIYYKNLV
jgi:GNAT superfamily N-acetyltransferase